MIFQQPPKGSRGRDFGGWNVGTQPGTAPAAASSAVSGACAQFAPCSKPDILLHKKSPSQGIKPFNRGSVGAQASSSAGVQSSPAMRDSNVYCFLLGQFSSVLDSGLTTQLGAGSIWIGFCQHGGALL